MLILNGLGRPSEILAGQ